MSGEDQAPGAALMPQTLEQRKAAWKRQYGAIFVLKLGSTECVFRPCDLDEWERLQDKLNQDRTPSAYLRELTLNVLLHPSRDEMSQMLQRWPAMPDRLVQVLREHGGGTVEIEIKKD